MAGNDVASCLSAVISAFQSGADIVHAIRERSEKKKRRKEKDIEQAVEEKMLQKALMDGANKCQSAFAEQRSRFGSDFETGDHTAVTALMTIRFNVHTEIISPLQIAKAVENAELDLTQLHEAAIHNKRRALDALNDLCQRISASRSMSTDSNYSNSGSSLDARHYRSTSLDDFPGASPMGGVDHYGSYHSVGQYNFSSPPLNRTHSVRYGADSVPHRRSSRAATELSSTPPSRTARNERSHSRNDRIDEQHEKHGLGKAHEQMSQLSLHDSPLNSETGSQHRTSTSINSALLSEEDGNSYSGARPLEQPPEYQLHLAPTTSLASDLSAEGQNERSDLLAPHLLRRDSADDLRRAESAPEVLTKEFESMLTQQPLRNAPHSYTPRAMDMKNIHPAFRGQYMEAPSALEPEPERIWSPLQRPAKINNYHGFCKGAWAARGSLQEGLSITMINNFRGENVPHWKCKTCEFMSRGVNNTKVLPDQIYFAGGIRYRWVFLAKSHVPSMKASNKPESYTYGCVFCAAQGHETGIYEGIEALMSHITNRHKTVSLTPEVLEKTGCLIGGNPDRHQAWDINVPASHGRKLSAALAVEQIDVVAAEHVDEDHDHDARNGAIRPDADPRSNSRSSSTSVAKDEGGGKSKGKKILKSLKPRLSGLSNVSVMY